MAILNYSSLLFLQLCLVSANPRTVEQCVQHIFARTRCTYTLLVQETGYELREVLKLDRCSFTSVDITSKPTGPSLAVEALLASFADVVLFEQFFTVRFAALDAVVAVYHGPDSNLHQVLAKLQKHNAVVVASNLSALTFGVSPTSCFDMKSLSSTRCRNCTLDVFGLYNPPFVDVGDFATNAGFEVRMLRLFLDGANVAPNFTCPTCFGKSNGRIILASFDVVVAGLQTTNPLNTDYYYRQLENAFFLPFPPALSPWKNLIAIFDWKTWGFLLASVVALVVTCYVLRVEAGVQDCTVFVVEVLFGPASTIPSGWRHLFLLWTLSSMLITNAYRSILVSFLFKVVLYPRLTTFEQLVDSGLDFGGNLIKFYLFKNDTPARIVERTTSSFAKANCSLNGWQCYERLLDGRFALFSTDYKVMFLRNDNRTHRFYKLAGFGRNYLTLSVKKRTVVTNELHKFLKRVGESGILTVLDRYEWKPSPEPAKIKYKDIDIGHLYFIFIVYAVCVAVATVVFAFEVLLHNEIRR